MTQQSLVISAIGTDQPGIVNAVSKNILAHDCNIADSRMAVLGGEFAIILHVTGSDNAITRLQQDLPGLENTLGLTLICKQTRDSTQDTGRIPYTVTAISIDHPGIVQGIAEFFASRNINIADLSTERYPAPHTGTAMFRLTLRVFIPAELRLQEIRDQFESFCDALNIDVSFNPATRS